MPLVSIIIPAYNVEPWIGEALASVLAQTVTDWECVIINDGSTDDTEFVAKSLDPRIRLITQKNAGVSAARNRGLEIAQGQFVAFLDADDVWHPQALEIMLAPLQLDADCALTWANFVRFRDKTNQYLPSPGVRIHSAHNIWHALLIDNFMQFGALCVRAHIAKQYLFSTAITICEDRDWLLRIVKNNKAIHIPRTVHYYRQRENSAVRDIQKFLHDEEKVLQLHLSDPDLPPQVRKRANSALAFHSAVLLAKQPRTKLRALRKYLEAIICDPLYLENYLKPFRKALTIIQPKQFLQLPIGNSSLPFN